MNQARRNEISRTAYELLTGCGISAYPVKLRDLVYSRYLKDKGFAFDTYEDIERYNEGVLKKKDRPGISLRGKDGIIAICEAAGFYLIIYNGRTRSQARVNWTLIHELAHVLLMFDGRRETSERECDHFTKLVLCHPLALLKYGAATKDKIQRLTKISAAAAAICEYELTQGVSFNEWDIKIGDLLFKE